MNFLQCTTSDRATRAEQRRAHILEIARRLFIDNGFHGTGVAQIAAASGVKVGQIYRDFTSKEEIIAAIALRDLSQFLDEDTLDAAIRAGDMAAIRQWISGFVRYDEDVDGYRLMPEIMAESARNPRIAQVRDEIHRRVGGALLAALAACAPGEERAKARAALADVIHTLAAGLCQSIVAAAQSGGDCRPLCAQLRVIVDRELDALIAG